jgi:hypothetical protein
VGEGVGVLTLALTGTGEMSTGCVPDEEVGVSDPEAVGVCVGRGGVSGDGVVGRLWGVAEGGANGERVRRAKEADVGGNDCTDGENVCCMAVAAADDGGKGAAALRCMRGGRSGA